MAFFKTAKLARFGDGRWMLTVYGDLVPEPVASDHKHPTEFHSVIDRLGREGWELVQVADDELTWYFKRQIA